MCARTEVIAHRTPMNLLHIRMVSEQLHAICQLSLWGPKNEYRRKCQEKRAKNTNTDADIHYQTNRNRMKKNCKFFHHAEYEN